MISKQNIDPGYPGETYKILAFQSFRRRKVVHIYSRDIFGSLLYLIKELLVLLNFVWFSSPCSYFVFCVSFVFIEM